MAFEVSIGSLDNPSITVQAQYRPAEITVDQTIGWNAHTARAGVWLEFSKSVSRGVAVELFLDATEGEKRSVMPWIVKLQKLASVRVPGSKVDELARPHHCILVFGNVFSKDMSLPCVIESMNTKYTRFSPSGEPIRATVSVKLKEARWLSQPKMDSRDEPDHGGELTAAERSGRDASAFEPPAARGAPFPAPSPRAPQVPPEEDWSCE